MNNAEVIMHTSLKCLMLGILGGVTLLLCDFLNRTYLKRSFIYNLIATFNLIVGSIGSFFLLAPGEQIPTLIAISLIIGVLMYRNILKA